MREHDADVTVADRDRGGIGESVTDVAVSRVLVVDDEVLVAEGVCALLATSPSVEVVGRARTIDEVIHLVASTPIDIVVTGERTRGGVVEVIAHVRRLAPAARIVVLADALNVGRVRSAMEAGARGYLLRSQSSEELFAALQVVRSGGVSLAQEAIDALVSRSRGGGDRRTLSPRELDVLQAVAATGSPKRAADELDISFNTVRNHLQHAITKLGAHSTVEAVVIALGEGMIEPPERTGG